MADSSYENLSREALIGLLEQARHRELELMEENSRLKAQLENRSEEAKTPNLVFKVSRRDPNQFAASYHAIHAGDSMEFDDPFLMSPVRKPAFGVGTLTPQFSQQPAVAAPEVTCLPPREEPKPIGAIVPNAPEDPPVEQRPAEEEAAAVPSAVPEQHETVAEVKPQAPAAPAQPQRDQKPNRVKYPPNFTPVKLDSRWLSTAPQQNPPPKERKFRQVQQASAPLQPVQEPRAQTSKFTAPKSQVPKSQEPRFQGGMTQESMPQEPKTQEARPQEPKSQEMADYEALMQDLSRFGF